MILNLQRSYYTNVFFKTKYFSYKKKIPVNSNSTARSGKSCILLVTQLSGLNIDSVCKKITC
jgi:hypothetical protein